MNNITEQMIRQECDRLDLCLNQFGYTIAFDIQDPRCLHLAVQIDAKTEDDTYSFDDVRNDLLTLIENCMENFVKVWRYNVMSSVCWIDDSHVSIHAWVPNIHSA